MPELIQNFYRELSSFEVVSIIGTIASLFGLAIAIIQTTRAKTSAEKAKEAALSTKMSVRDSLLVGESEKANKLTDEIKDLLSQFDATHATVLRLRDLRDALVKLKHLIPDVTEEAKETFQYYVSYSSSLEAVLITDIDNPELSRKKQNAIKKFSSLSVFISDLSATTGLAELTRS